MWLGGLIAGSLGLIASLVLSPFAPTVFVFGFAFMLVRPWAASVGGVLTSAGLWMLYQELRLAQACNEMNLSPQGRCTHEDVTVKILVEAGLFALGAALSTYAFARTR